MSDSQWVKFCLEFNFDEFSNDASLNTNVQRVLNRNRIIEKVSERFKQIELDELSARLKSIGLPYAPINRPEDLSEDRHLIESGGLLNVELSDGKQAQLPALPIEFSDRRLGLRHNIPSMGEHTKEVLEELGYTEQKACDLIDHKIAG